MSSFQTDSPVGGPGVFSVVPPTAVTNGWLAASSTARRELPSQPSDPASPVATKMLWPCVAACSNSVFSALSALGSFIRVDDSHRPHESLTTLAVLALTMFWNVS